MNRRDLGGPLLASVSRSFYLSIRILPPAVREPIGLGYLLARISDTLADSATVEVSVRLRALEAFGYAVQTGATFEVPPGFRPELEAEQRLLAHTEGALEWLASVPEADRQDVREVLREIIAGQRSDLTRPWPVASEAELEAYIYSVAGCVGEFWTKVCLRHVPGYSALAPESLTVLGVEFGKGLQLVNVLRDVPEDRRNGRDYLPVTTDHPEPFGFWLTRAEEYLESAYRYTRSLRPWRLRYACILPWALGVMTLRLVAADRRCPPEKKVKVPRAMVKQLLWRAFLPAFSNRALDSLRQRL